MTRRKSGQFKGRPHIVPEKIEANKALADVGRGLDSLGRRKAGSQSVLEVGTYHDDETGEEYEAERWVPREEIRCRAIARGRDNPWRGNRCARAAIKGGTVCRIHGGNLPGVKKAAQRRLAMAALPASQKLVWIALHKKGVADKDRIRALIEILDRAGVSGKTTIEVEVKPWEKVLRSIYAGMEGSGEEDVVDLEEGEDYEIMDIDEEGD